MLHGTQSINFP